MTGLPRAGSGVALSPRVGELRQVFQERYGFFVEAVDRAAERFGHPWVAELEETLARLFPEPADLARAVDGYARFSMDLMRRQRRFERERVYPVKTYAEAAEEVYLNAEFMSSQYLPGLLLAHYLWRHHCDHRRFFQSAFVGAMVVGRAAEFTEVGIGTGLYARRILQELPGVRGTGYDISPAAKAFADRHVAAFGFQNRFQTVLRDVIADPVPPSQWLVCIEVLEHLEDPVTFLHGLRRIVTPGGTAFITAALNAANVDHIYLYERPEDVAGHLRVAGFEVRSEFVATAYPPPAPGTPVPSVAAFVLR